MDVNLSGEWALFIARKEIKEEDFRLNAEFSQKKLKVYTVPAPIWSNHFEGAESAWIKKDFTYNGIPDQFTYLVLFGADNGNIWLNGVLIGTIKRSAGKQVFDISKAVGKNNCLVIQFVPIKSETVGLWKNAFIINGSSVPDVAKKPYQQKSKWIDNAIIYTLFPRNFSENGNLEGIIKKLPYLKSLGINIINLLPIHPIGDIRRKGGSGSPYAVKDYYSIHPDLGSLDNFKLLIDQCHRLDIKLLMNIVANHTSTDHPLKSSNINFYKPENLQSVHNWGWTDVDELDYSQQHTRNYMKEVFLYWTKEFDIDGFQCDLADLVPFSFWKEVIPVLRSVKPEIIMLADSDNPALYAAGFDLTYDRCFSGVLNRIRSHFYEVDELSNYIITQYQYYPQNSKRILYFENQDSGRSASFIPKNQLMPYQLIKFFTPGIPMIYNGEEMACENPANLLEKDPISWKDSKNHYFEFYKDLLSIRKRIEPLNQHSIDNFSFRKGLTHFEIIRTSADKQIRAVVDIERANITLIKNGKKYKSIACYI